MNAAPSPVFAYLRQPSLVDYPGHLAGVFFTSGCNLSCGFCHNAALMGRSRPGLSWDKLDEACRRFRDNWVTGAVITGGEPTLADGLGDLVDFFKARGFAVKVDTNGTDPDTVRAVAGRVDCLAMDVKASLDAYPGLTGWTDAERLRESVGIVRDSPGGVFRTTIVESFHTDDMMHRIGGLIRGAAAYQMQAFVPREDLPDPAFRGLPRTSAARLEALRELMKPYAGRIDVRGG